MGAEKGARQPSHVIVPDGWFLVCLERSKAEISGPPLYFAELQRHFSETDTYDANRVYTVVAWGGSPNEALDKANNMVRNLS